MRPLGRPWCKWVGNIKINLVEIRLGGVDWIGLAQDREKWKALVNAVMNLLVLLNAGRLPLGFTTVGFPSGAQLHKFRYFTTLSLYNLMV
jgi:hypothetical protein